MDGWTAWIIGVFFTYGIMAEDVEKQSPGDQVITAIFIFLMWPKYLGVCVAERIKEICPKKKQSGK